MRLTLYLLIIYIAILTAGCSGHADRESTADGAHNTQFDKTISKADSLYNCMQFRDAYKLYLQLLDNKEVKADSEKRLRVLNDLSISSELSGNKVEQSKWLNQLLDLAAQTNNDYYHSLALLTIGLNVFYEGNHEKGIKNVAEAVRLMAKTDREDADHLMHGHLIMLARLYGETKDYDNAQKTNERNLQLTMQGTRWGTAPSQQLIDRRMALAKIAALQAKLGHFQRADSAYDAWKAIQYEGNQQATTTDNDANWTWGFAEHQYDYVGNAAANISINGSTWRVLTNTEWNYIINTRLATQIGGVSARYARATINGVMGLIPFPDKYEHPDAVTTPINQC